MRRIVYSNYGLSYIRIKKVASTSITAAFTDGNQIIGDTVVKGDFSFAVVRDPIERFLSAWDHHKGPLQHVDNQCTLTDLLDLMPEGHKGLGMDDNHLIPQERFLEGHEVDLVFTLDALPEMWEHLQALFPELPDLPHHNRSGYEIPCTSEERERIEALYA